MATLHHIRAWYAVFIAIACTLGTSCAPQQRAEGLRVMSYNIAAGHGDLTQIAEVIRAAGADIVALQEVDVHWNERSGFADQAALLADALGMHVRFGPIYQLPGAGPSPVREFGLAILSSHPIVEFRNHEISRLSTQSADPEPRLMPGFLDATVQLGGTRVRVFNTHLDYRRDPRVRTQQVAEMLALMKDVADPLILMGDLNARPDAVEIVPLFLRLRDAWSANDAGHTYPADAPDRRIDYILLSGHFAVRGTRVIATTASDHRPVVADMLLRQAR